VKIKGRLALVLAILGLTTLGLAPAPASADRVVGFATIVMKNVTAYQPGSCATQPEVEGEICIDFAPWRIYKVKDFRDLDGHKLKIGTMAMTSHLPRAGRWLLVLEELSPADQRAFGARYRFVDGSVRFEVFCTRRPFREYHATQNPVPPLSEADDDHCYRVDNVVHSGV